MQLCSLGGAWFSGINFVPIKHPHLQPLVFPQEMKICGPKGRDCIEGNSTKSSNCSTTCQGIYADVQWVGKKIEEIVDEEVEADFEKEFKGSDDETSSNLLRRLADLEKKMRLMEGALGEKGEELDKEKYKLLIAEYRKFKTTNVKHFRFNSAKNSTAFGKSLFISILKILSFKDISMKKQR